MSVQQFSNCSSSVFPPQFILIHNMICLTNVEILLVALIFQNQVKYLNVTCGLNELPIFLSFSPPRGSAFHAIWTIELHFYFLENLEPDFYQAKWHSPQARENRSDEQSAQKMSCYHYPKECFNWSLILFRKPSHSPVSCKVGSCNQIEIKYQTSCFLCLCIPCNVLAVVSGEI